MKDFYQFYRILGTPIFKTFYHPTIINSNLIPTEGPVIFCGNHLHVWDQFPVVVSTKRKIHWMAKKEYFEGKLAPFFKTSGCISVDRVNNPHQSKIDAINYLRKGEAVGLFPEGTRNKYQVEKNKYDLLMEKYAKLLNKNDLRRDQLEQLKQEIEITKNNIEIEKNILINRGYEVIDDDILLPFKFGAVSMAKEADALIVPFAVTGDYTINNDNLTVQYGDPFKVEDMSLEDANNKLRNDVKQLIKKNRK